MATCGYGSVKEFQKAEVMVAPALLTEGKVAPTFAARRDGPLTDALTSPAPNPLGASPVGGPVPGAGPWRLVAKRSAARAY